MNLRLLLSDPDLGGGAFTILRKTWTRENGLPVMTDLETVHAAGILHPERYFILEHGDEHSFVNHPRFVKERHYGRVHFSFFE